MALYEDGPEPVVVKRIICLANSRKLNERCIAGREIDGGFVKGWIRPIGDRPHGEVSGYERRYSNGSEPQLLDVIDIPLISAHPNLRQKENWILDPDLYWEKVGELAPRQLQDLVEMQGPLWVNGRNTYHGANDYVTLDEAERSDESLRLIFVSDGLQLQVHTPGAAFGDTKRKVRAIFSFNGVEYRLMVTDPIVESRYLAQADRVHMLGSSYLTVSLGEPYDGNCYKLIAAIIGA